MKKIICILIMVSCLFSQSKRDPRAVALAGSYTTIANGIFSVGYNPGLIGLQQNRPLTIQGFQLDFGIVGIFFPLKILPNIVEILYQQEMLIGLLITWNSRMGLLFLWIPTCQYL